MTRITLGVVVAATCVPMIAAGSTIRIGSGGSSDRISLQIAPDGAPGERGRTRSVRELRAPVGLADLDETIVLSPPRSPRGECSSASQSNNSNGDCRDILEWTGNGRPDDTEIPIDPVGDQRQGNTPQDVWNDAAPGQSDEDFVADQVDKENGAAVGNLGDEEVRPHDVRDENDIAEAPESSTMLLMGGALFALGYYKKKRNG